MEDVLSVKEYFNDSEVVITTEKAQFGKAAYPMLDISGVAATKTAKNTSALVGGIAIAVLGGLLQISLALLGGIVLAIIGLVVFLVSKPKYAVDLTTSAGTQRAFVSPTPESPNAIAEALKLAIAETEPQRAAAREQTEAAKALEAEEPIKCPKCGSKQVTANQKGFSGGKAVAGAVLLGPIGLLGGTIGSKKVKIACLKCGYQWEPGRS